MLSVFKRIGRALGLVAKPRPASQIIIHISAPDPAGNDLFRASMRELAASMKLRKASDEFAAVILDALQNG